MSTEMKLVCTLAVLVASTLLAASASAQWYSPLCCGGSYSYFGCYSGWCLEEPPYFACHPPVYYRMSAAAVDHSGRTSSGHVATAPAAPLRIENPFVTRDATGDTAGGPAAVKPLRIRNVYVAAKS